MFERVSLDKFRPQTFETREIGTVIGVMITFAVIAKSGNVEVASIAQTLGAICFTGNTS